MPQTVLIVGAREFSLGREVENRLKSEYHYVRTITAGISGEEDYFLEVRNHTQIQKVLSEVNPDVVLYTAGVNIPRELSDEDFFTSIRTEVDVNYLGAMATLQVWLDLHPEFPVYHKQFVAVSSNSAHIARSPSLGYCASKAALSMGIKTAARWVSKKNPEDHPSIWGVEPGFIGGTPMSIGTEADLEPGLPHRIPDGYSVEKGWLAFFLADSLVDNDNGALFHGQMIRIDGGEQ